ncbi:MAG TPA: dihydrolipoamide acetyltransferase family protein [Steroidobacteraceae bacterium]|nr:dihydrolipoamide acetyltransferase family protein [Steroidobacteraceae bacterium]
MSKYVFKLPDLGEGTVSAEIVNWRVKPGDTVAEDEIIVEVMTEKAAVEVPAPVSGRVLSTTGAPGDTVPVGAELIVFDTEPGAPSHAAAPAAAPSAPPAAAARANGNGAAVAAAAPAAPMAAPASAPASARVATSPAIRRRAHEAGIDLRQVAGSGPNGRIVAKDLDTHVARRGAAPTPLRAAPKAVPSAKSPARGGGAIEEIKVIGLRRLIAQRMSEAKRNIPHFAYVEELDITELESLRSHLNGKRAAGTATLTYLPFLALALVRVLREFPQCNAHYDAERGVLVRYGAVHLGVATQTPDGLKVPVVHDAQALSLWELAAEMRRVSEAARSNKATREELSGSTITITSLGKLGGIASTPIINAPEVAIIGVNRAVERPVVLAGSIAVRLTMNLSSSFDHRFVDGYDAAAMIQALKECLEHPATIFLSA